jgi:hypothetical protein
MLTAYLDETGHSRDEKQKFVGIAGLIAPASEWIVFEEKWKAALALPHFNLPHFHMTDYVSKKKVYKDWNEKKRKKVFGKLMNIIESIYPLPFGAIVPMDIFRRFTKEQQSYFDDPYHLCFQSVIPACTVFIERMKNVAAEEKVALIFSNQVEFKHRALQIYEQVAETQYYMRRTTPPNFRAMRDFAPLQAADIIAYEMYKEFDRRLYRPTEKPRHGFDRIELMSKRWNLQSSMFRFFSESDIAALVRRREKTNELKDLIKKKLE